MQQTFSAFDPANRGANLVYSNANTVVSHIGVDTINRTALGLFDQSDYINMVEFLCYGTGTLSGYVSVGVVKTSTSPSFALTNFVGKTADSIGFRPAEGQIWTNNASSVTAVACAKNDIIGMVCDIIALRLTFTKNGVVIGTIALPDSGPWVWAVSVGGLAANDMYVFANCGQQRFKYPLDTSLGWWIGRAQINPIAIASEDYISLPTDTIPSVPYDGAMEPENSTALTIQRIVNPWVWREQGGSVSGGVSFGSITLTNAPSLDGLPGPYDFLIDPSEPDPRDTDVAISRLELGDGVDDAVSIGVGVIDRVQNNGDYQLQVFIKDQLAVMDSVFQRSLFLPNVDTSAAGRPEPASIGACRNVQGVLIDDTTHTYAFHDAVIGQFGNVRVAGAIISTIGTTPTYALSSDGKSIVLSAAPAGKVTAELSGLGADPAPGAPDLLLGHGEFNTFTVSGDLTTYWDLHTSASGFPSLITSAGYGQVNFPIQGTGLANWITYKSNIIQTGKAYLVTIDIDALPGQSLIFYGTSSLSYMYIDGKNFGYGACGWGNYLYNQTPTAASPTNIHPPSQAQIRFTNTQGADLPLVLGWISNDGVADAKVKAIHLYELPSATSVSSLTGITLETMMHQIIEIRGGLDPSVWDASDAAAIDTATGYVSLGVHIEQPMSIRNALQAALDSYCADLYIDRSGVVRPFRLTDPGDVVSSGTIDESVILGPVAGGGQDSMIQVEPDDAKGLTTSLGCRRNWSVFTDGDFGATTVLDCPNSVRALLKQQYQSIVSSGAQLSQAYLAAQKANPQPTLFDDPDEAQIECDRVATLYTVPRMKYHVPVKADNSDAYEIGQAWQLVYPRYGLDNGKAVLIYGITENPITEQLTLHCWG